MLALNCVASLPDVFSLVSEESDDGDQRAFHNQWQEEQDDEEVCLIGGDGRGGVSGASWRYV